MFCTRLAEWDRKLIPEMRWCIAKWTTGDFYRCRWLREGDNRWGVSSKVYLEIDSKYLITWGLHSKLYISGINLHQSTSYMYQQLICSLLRIRRCIIIFIQYKFIWKLINHISILEAYILSCMTHIWYKPSPIKFLSLPAIGILSIER